MPMKLDLVRRLTGAGALGSNLRIKQGLPLRILRRRNVRPPATVRSRLELSGFRLASGVHSQIFLVQHDPHLAICFRGTK
jgi:hypothetical protein